MCTGPVNLTWTYTAGAARWYRIDAEFDSEKVVSDDTKSTAAFKKTVYIVIVTADLTADKNYLHVNDDYDEGKAALDNADESPVNHTGTAIVTDDMVILTPALEPWDDDVLEGAEVKLTASDSNVVRVIAVDPNAKKPFAEDIAWTVVPFNTDLATDFFKQKANGNGKYRDFQWYAEGLAPGFCDLTLSYRAPDGLTISDAITLTVIKADLDAMKVSHNAANGELPDARETTPGAFVPINNDDDDYSAVPGGSAGADKDQDQSKAIASESDLLHIILHKTNPTVPGGKYTLEIPGCVHVWKKDDRTDRVKPKGDPAGATPFNANSDTTLYVEGYNIGKGKIKLNWTDGPHTFDACDEVKVTVFNWGGPLNVPGYAIYEYEADGALSGSQWTTPSSGTINSGAGTSDVTILWGFGPVVGKAIYKVNDDYLWDLEVNVVKIDVHCSSASIKRNNWPVQDQGDRRCINSTSDKAVPAIESNLSVGWECPKVSGKLRGAKFLEMGFIQNWHMAQWHADFSAAGKKRVSSLEVQEGLDTCNGSTEPWYNTDPNMSPKSFRHPDSDDTMGVAGFGMNDRPSVPGTDHFQLKFGDVTYTVDYFHLRMEFSIYFAVRTTQAVNGSETVYTQRAVASWHFDGSGKINAYHVWHRGNAAGNFIDSAFAEVKTGAIVPHTTGTPFNSLPIGWTTEEK